MKKQISVAVIVLVFACLFAIQAQTGSRSQPRPASGTVEIDYNVTRNPGRGSNQWVIWIEDSAGRYIRTLFLTNYMGAKQGWKVRTQSLVTWGKASNVANTPQESIDAVSGATPQSGPHKVVWDLRDRDGNPVNPGTYIYRIEASLFMQNTALWTGQINVGSTPDNSSPSVSFFPAGADTLGGIISDVRAVFKPAR